MAAISGSTRLRRRWSSTTSNCSSSSFLSGAGLGAELALSCGAAGSPEHSRSPAPRTAPSPPGQPRGVQEEPLAFPAPFGTGAPCPAAGSPHPRALAAPARYLGADKDLPEQGLDVVVGSSHDDRDLVSGEDVLDVPQSGSTSRGAGCGGLQAAAGPDPCGHPMILGPRPPPQPTEPLRLQSRAVARPHSPPVPPNLRDTQGPPGRAAPGSARLGAARGLPRAARSSEPPLPEASSGNKLAPPRSPGPGRTPSSLPGLSVEEGSPNLPGQAARSWKDIRGTALSLKSTTV